MIQVGSKNILQMAVVFFYFLARIKLKPKRTQVQPQKGKHELKSNKFTWLCHYEIKFYHLIFGICFQMNVLHTHDTLKLNKKSPIDFFSQLTLFAEGNQNKYWINYSLLTNFVNNSFSLFMFSSRRSDNWWHK